MKKASKIVALIASVNLLVMLSFEPLKGLNIIGFEFVFKTHTVGAILLFISILLVIILNILSMVGKNYKLLIQLDAPIFKYLNIILSIYIIIAYLLFNKYFMCNNNIGYKISYISYIGMICAIFNVIFNTIDGFVVEN